MLQLGRWGFGRANGSRLYPAGHLRAAFLTGFCSAGRCCFLQETVELCPAARTPTNPLQLTSDRGEPYCLGTDSPKAEDPGAGIKWGLGKTVGNLGFQGWSVANSQLLAQKTASLRAMETGVCREPGLPEYLQVINQASKQLNQVPSLHPDKSAFLRKDTGPQG